MSKLNRNLGFERMNRLQALEQDQLKDQDRKPRWFFIVRQTTHSILVEVRPYEGEDGGYIGAFKQAQLESRELLPATVRIGLSFDGYGDNGLPLDKAWQLAEWLQAAAILAEQLDHYIKTPADFKQKFEAVQYSREGMCYVSPVKEPTVYQQKQGPEWVSGEE